MVIALATSPAIASSSFQGAAATQTWTSNTFSPPAGSVIVVVAAATQSFNNAWVAPQLVDSLGALTWTRAAVQNDISFAGVTSQISVWWAYCPTAQTNMTVTLTSTVGGTGQTITFSSLAVEIWTGTDPGAPLVGMNQGYQVAQTLAVTDSPTVAGSVLLLGAINSAAGSAVSTVTAGNAFIGETHSGPSFLHEYVGFAGNPTNGPAATTMGASNATAASKWQWITFELQPPLKGGIFLLEDGSVLFVEDNTLMLNEKTWTTSRLTSASIVST